MSRKKGKPCYFCGAPSVSTEHVPPQQMFKDFDCDSITVPSCNNHNTQKSSIDQAVSNAFLIPLHNNLKNNEYGIKKVIVNAQESFKYTKNMVLNVPLFNEANGIFFGLPNVSYTKPSVKTRTWIKQLTAALVYNAINSYDSTINWEEVITWSPNWVGTDNPKEMTKDSAYSVLDKNNEIRFYFESLEWQLGWSARPRPYPSSIFQFGLHFESNCVFFSHKFYNQYTWYVILPVVIESTLTRLKAKIFEKF
jgi:hypothetical protein